MGKENLTCFEQDTIVAQATPAGFGGVGIVRLSGKKTAEIAKSMLGCLPRVRYSHFGSFLGEDKNVLDHGIALYFQAPHSFTGEDVLELQGHGGPYLIDSLIKRAIALGARQAEPGEFSKRAFLNNKLDLAQAEAVADLIHATSETAAKAALKTLDGEFSSEINALVERVIWLRMYIESMIDFSDEDIESLGTAKIESVFSELKEKLKAILQNATQGVVLTEGLTVVLCGEPNVGKSSLLNKLAKEEVAIVTEIPGTTRDVLSTTVHVKGVPINLLDTAGLRETTDIVESKGIERTLEKAKKADLLLIVRDANESASLELTAKEKKWFSSFSKDAPYFIVANKIDQYGLKPLASIHEKDKVTSVHLSAKTGEGLDFLKDALFDFVGIGTSSEGNYSAKRRHVESLEQALKYLLDAKQSLDKNHGFELVAESLRLGQNALGEITGKMTSDDLLGKIFSEFCIGK